MSLLAPQEQSLNTTGIPDLAAIRGLSEQEVQSRFKQEGYNELPAGRRRSLFTIALDVVREPMFLLLIAGCAIYLVLGDTREALVLLGSILVIMGITFYQEQKTERALEVLRDLSSPRALVIRGGEQQRIAGRDVVRDDLVVLAEGDRVPADGILLWGLNLSVDESLLTGESVPVRKVAAISGAVMSGMGRPGGDDLPFVFSGTLVTQGQGIAKIQATGIRTELGKIGTALQTVKPEQTRLQRETGRLVRLMAVAGLALCALVVVLYGLFRGDWLNGLLAGIALAMSLLPEEFPVVLTVFLALGAWRIAQHHVLTRRMPAIETLGAATILCVDKTGTLTENRMSVRMLFAQGISYEVQADAQQPLPEGFHELVELAVLASQQDPFDPMEQALRKLGERFLAGTEHLPNNWTLLREYPLSPQLLAISHVWKPSRPEAAYVIAAKGAPEAIVDLCHLDEGTKAAIFEQVHRMANEGLRVLGVAHAQFQPAASLPPKQHDFPFEFVGLVGLADPVRPTVPTAIQECYTAGIRVVMITGDYPLTAQQIGRQIGLHPIDACITGPELDEMDDDTLQERINTTALFARVVPEQKLRLVNALKANGEVVAMTGDGVNDAPALKAAHIGIAMGKRGTDVARESAALVLLDDDFSSIVQAVRLGRRIYDNIRKALTYILAVHIPIAGIALLPLLFGWPLVLLPLHIVFLELIIDPASSVVFEAEPENPEVMKRPPHDQHEPLFGRRALLMGLLQGMGALALVLVVFLLAQARHLDEPTMRTMAFITLVIANLGLILANRSYSHTILVTLGKRNAALWWVTGGTILLLGLVLLIPMVRDLFTFSLPSIPELLLCLAAGIVCLLWFEVVKIIVRRYVKHE
jgi:P-type Ca2+ transporter type 2C